MNHIESNLQLIFSMIKLRVKKGLVGAMDPVIRRNPLEARRSPRAARHNTTNLYDLRDLTE